MSDARDQTAHGGDGAGRPDADAEARLREAITYMSDGLAVYDAAGRMVVCNDSFRRINNYTEADTRPGVATYDGLGKLDEAQASVDHKPLSFDERIAQLRRDGTNVVIQYHGDQVFERHQSATPSGGMINLLTDITELKRTEEALRQALDLADQSSRAKSEFLATMSHEIRTPIAGILGLADILLDDGQFDDALSEERREKVRSIRGAGRSLITILNDILDLSKIQSGKLELEYIDFDLHALIAETLEIFYPTAHAKGVALGSKIEPGLPVAVSGDPTRIRQILVNLIGNAVKFTERGSVTLSVAATGRSDGDLTCRFEVIDTGIGIAADHLGGLFEDFSQIDASTARKYAGTGLGLSISKRLTVLMGGDIGVDSAVGEGSTFWFALPVAPAKTAIAKTAEAPGEVDYRATRSLQILLAEDNDLNQMIATAVLSQFDHRVTVVDNGRAAIKAARRETFDLILMDVRMPEMDGPDATRVIRQEPTAIADIPIIAVTADAIVENRQDYLAAGMNACVTKPINVPDLLRAINEVLGEEVHVEISRRAPAG